MNVDLLHKVFANDEDAIQAFSESDCCAVIDWRDGFGEILEAVTHFLPDDYVRLTEVCTNSCKVSVGEKIIDLEVPSQAKQESLIDLVNKVLQPQYEIRQFRPANGDAHSLFVAPSEFWRDIEARDPKSVEKYFLSTARLAAYWNKNFFVRLLSKP